MPKPAKPLTVHDHFFKGFFSRPAEATVFLKAHLPPALVAAIRWETLTCLRGAFEDRDGRTKATDILFGVQLVGPDGAEASEVELMIVLEHQRRPHRRMPLRMLGYILRAYEEQLKRHGRKRPIPVIPFVLYNGRARWKVATSFLDWLELPPDQRALLGDHIPDFRYLLEVRREPHPDAYPEQDPVVRFARLIFDHAEDRNLEATLTLWQPVLRAIGELDGADELVSPLDLITDYLFRMRNNGVQLLIAAIEASNATRLKEKTMTQYERALASRYTEGRAEGRAEGQQALLLRMCERRFGPLPQAARDRIAAADDALMMLWGENFAVARTLDEVFGLPS